MPFTSVLDDLQEAFAGMRVGNNYDVDSAFNDEASDEIPMGVFVKDGTNEGGVIKLTAITDKIVGAVMYAATYSKDHLMGSTGLKPKTQFGLMRRGRLWMPCEEAVTRASDVLVRAVVAGAEVAGSVRDTADASDLIDASAWARFIKYNATLGLALVEFDVTGRNATPL